jgi:type II secretory ATPase GspE/PulE/Tfp pilus assembly ATPase PilB-like protein
MDSRIHAAQRSIAQHLVVAGKITQQQADTMPTSDAMSNIIPDLWRVCKDDEAVCQAVAKHLGRVHFVKLEDGVDLTLGTRGESWIIYGDTIYLTNPLETRQHESASAFARARNISASKIGVISLSKIESIKSSVTLDGIEPQDKEAQVIHARQRIEELIREAAKLDASDIHLQPTQGDEIAVRMRIDGELITKRKYSLQLHESIARVLMETFCVLTLEMNTTQDGKFSFDINAHKKISLRVNSLPVVKSSDKVLKFVLRLLGNNTTLSSLEKLGLSPVNMAKLRRLGESPNGLIIMTGPTGSGKTTALNALLMDIYGREPNRNYHTIEDPVEIQHEGMSHTEVGPTLSFAQALRALLRQDPDVILVGEIRDNETAELAYKAGMTGHLVLSTLHTNNSHESIGRLIGMDVPTDIIAGNTTAFIAQRLVRTLCGHCKVEYLFRSDAKRFGLYGQDRIFNGNGELRVFRANPDGCAHCNPDGRSAGGLKGRRSIIEILELEPEVQEAILSGVPPSVLRRSQIANGQFDDLWTDALRLVKEGVVGFEQIETTLPAFASQRVIGRKAEVVQGIVPAERPKLTAQL